jgi:hypothetical protein
LIFYNKVSKKEIKKTISFIIATKIADLTKAVRDAYIKKPLIIYEIKWK